MTFSAKTSDVHCAVTLIFYLVFNFLRKLTKLTASHKQN